MENNIKALEKFLFFNGKIARTNENLFSDIVKSMCDASDRFLNLLFQLSFPSEKEVTPIYILREQQIAEDSRIDFAIHTQGHGIFYIENKITDRNIIPNATKYIEHLKDKYGEKANKHLTYILPQKDYITEINELRENNINCISWEKVIDKCIKDKINHDFSIIISSIIQYYPNNSIFFNVPNCKDIKILKEKCDSIFDNILSSKYFNKKREDWDNDRFYGYNFIDHLWFGINYCPIKGLFFCFTYDYKQYNKLIKNGERSINYQMEFKYLKPLGNYHSDSDIYLEILNENVYNISEERFKEAFKELGQFIQVIDNENKIPINVFLLD